MYAKVGLTHLIFGFRQFSFATIGAKQSVDVNDIDATFTNQSVTSGIFEIVTNRGRDGNPDVLDQDTYNGERYIHAGFVNATYELNDKLTLDGGLRVEYINQSVTWDFNQDRNRFPGDNLAQIENTYLLPSLNIRYALNDDNILRFASSKTYTMPQFKEVAPFLYEDISSASFGNENLTPSDVYNFDLKFDHYFSRGELISIGTFYKQVSNSINRILVESAATELSYVNSGDVQITGVEVELRKNLWNITPEMYFDGGVNVSYLYTNQELIDSPNDNLQARFTNSDAQMQGASPLLINADLTFRREGPSLNLTSTLVYESFYDRIFSIGTSGVNDIMELSVGQLDWVTKLGITERFNLQLSVKNITNPAIRYESENAATGEALNIREFKRGTEFKIGIAYRVH